MNIPDNIIQGGITKLKALGFSEEEINMTYIQRTSFKQKPKGNKYGARRTEYDGVVYDSAFEAGVAQDLDIQKKAGLIKDWERQFKVEMWAYNIHGHAVMKKTHRVDFRVHELDGSFTLLEAKGLETPDYRDRRHWLEKFWLPANLDHTYTVVKQGSKGWRAFKPS